MQNGSARGQAPLTYSIEEAARLLGVSERHAYTYARRNEFPTSIIRIGHRMLVPKAELDALLMCTSESKNSHGTS
ncbi:MAG: helix-turn-helix domain-containing protein [Dehalococcoidia bacterium]